MTDFNAILDVPRSHAMASGVFESVQGHEPKNAPQNGITAATWVQDIGGLPDASGLNATTGLLQLQFRIYQNFLSEPLDAIDPALLAATDVMLTALSGDFTLGGTVRNIDLLKRFSDGLIARAGYLNQDSKLFRVMDIFIPVVINDLWTQVA